MMEMDELHIIVNDIVTWCVKAGWNILGAIVIYVVGRYLIGIIKKLTRNLLDKRKVEASVETFLLSFVNITLTILLVIAIAARLGVETTSFAALLASAGVAIGMALIARAAAAKGYCDQETVERLTAALRDYGLPTETDFSLKELAAAMALDKKRTGSTMHLVVPEAIGRCRILAVPVSEIPDWLRAGGAV